MHTQVVPQKLCSKARITLGHVKILNIAKVFPTKSIINLLAQRRPSVARDQPLRGRSIGTRPRKLIASHPRQARRAKRGLCSANRHSAHATI